MTILIQDEYTNTLATSTNKTFTAATYETNTSGYLVNHNGDELKDLNGTRTKNPYAVANPNELVLKTAESVNGAVHIEWVSQYITGTKTNQRVETELHEWNGWVATASNGTTYITYKRYTGVLAQLPENALETSRITNKLEFVYENNTARLVKVSRFFPNGYSYVSEYSQTGTLLTETYSHNGKPLKPETVIVNGGTQTRTPAKQFEDGIKKFNTVKGYYNDDLIPQKNVVVYNKGCLAIEVTKSYDDFLKTGVKKLCDWFFYPQYSKSAQPKTLNTKTKIQIPATDFNSVVNIDRNYFARSTIFVKNLIGDIVFNNCTEVKESGLRYQFIGCENIQNVSFPKLTTIGEWGMAEAFYDCKQLKSINFPLVSFIGKYGMFASFYNTALITTVSFPKLTKVQDHGLCRAFEGCINLAPTELVFAELQSAGEASFQEAFKNCKRLKGTVKFPKLFGAGTAKATHGETSELPTTGNTVNDVRIVTTSVGIDRYTWTGSKWEQTAYLKFSAFVRCFYGCPLIRKIQFPKILEGYGFLSKDVLGCENAEIQFVDED